MLYTCSLYEQGICTRSRWYARYKLPLRSLISFIHVRFDAELAVCNRPFCVVRYTYLVAIPNKYRENDWAVAKEVSHLLSIPYPSYFFSDL